MKKKTRSANGSGSFYFNEKRNRFEYRITYYDHFDRPKKKTFYGVSKDICQEKADAFLKHLALGLSEEQETITIPMILRHEYDHDYELNQFIESTYRRKLYTVKIIEKSPLGEIPIVDIKKRHIEAFIKEIKRYSNSVIKKVYSAVNNAFKIAIEEGIISENPLDDRNIKMPKSDKPDRKVFAFDIEQQKAFIDVVNNNYKPKANSNYYKNQLLISLYTGLRMGEVNALNVEDIDLNHGLLYVRKTVTTTLGDKPVIGIKTKTYSGNRVVLLTEDAKKVLADALAAAGSNPNGMLFWNHISNRPNDTSSVNSAFKRLCDKAGVPCHGVHSLRHTFATRAIESGVPAVTLKNWMGHKDISITLNTYTDVFAKMENEALAKMNNYYKENL